MFDEYNLYKKQFQLICTKQGNDSEFLKLGRYETGQQKVETSYIKKNFKK
jgi:hypothetical protein